MNLLVIIHGITLLPLFVAEFKIAVVSSLCDNTLDTPSFVFSMLIVTLQGMLNGFKISYTFILFGFRVKLVVCFILDKPKSSQQF